MAVCTYQVKVCCLTDLEHVCLRYASIIGQKNRYALEDMSHATHFRIFFVGNILLQGLNDLPMILFALHLCMAQENVTLTNFLLPEHAFHFC